MRNRVVKTMIMVVIVCGLIVGNISTASQEASESKSVYASTSKGEVVTSAGVIESKEEVIYSSIGTDGTVLNNYTVNILNVTASGEVYDYGYYDSLKNLTNINPIQYEEGKVSVAADKGRFYYQGNLSDKNLPWNIMITYQLDGEEIEGKDLAGKTGVLEVNIKTSRNPQIKDSFYNNFMMQVSVTLDSENCQNIVAEGGTFANAGSDKLITFTVMPGKDGDITLKSDVSNFEMKGITISAVPFSMKVDIGDTSKMTEGLSSLSDAIKQLNEGISELNTGAEQLRDGASSLKEGSKEYQAGIKKLADNSDTLVSGSEKILEDLQYIDAKEGNSTLSEQYRAFNNGLAAYTEAVKALAEGYEELNSGIASVSGGMSGLSEGITKVSEGSSELYMATSDLPNQMQQSIDEMMDEYDKSDYSPVSFVSDKNEKVTSVQFVITSKAIVKEKEIETVQKEENEENFLTRLIALFK